MKRKVLAISLFLFTLWDLLSFELLVDKEGLLATM